jgi:tetratricopeptide (TPR) repeat protein
LEILSETRKRGNPDCHPPVGDPYVSPVTANRSHGEKSSQVQHAAEAAAPAPANGFEAAQKVIELGQQSDAMKVFHTLATGAYSGRGSAWQLKHDNDKALADFNEAIRFDPQGAGERVCRGRVWQDKGEYAKALADYDDALRLDASIFAAHVYRARILAACPDPKFRNGPKAIMAATKALLTACRNGIAERSAGRARWKEPAEDHTE